MMIKRLLRNALLFVLAALMLGIVPVHAADTGVQADYNLYIYAGAAEQGDTLVIRSGDEEYRYSVSTKAVRGLDISDSRSYAGDFAAVAGAEGMLLTLTDPDCKGIEVKGNWKDSLDAEDLTLTFNGQEQDFTGEALELECAFGSLAVSRDGSIVFTADASAPLVTISQSSGESNCSVSLQRRNRALPKDTTVEVVLKQSEMDDDWTGVPLPHGMAVDPDSLTWNPYVQYSVAYGNLFCRQVKEFPLNAKTPVGAQKNQFTLVQKGELTASGDWGHDVRNSKKVVRFNGAGHAIGTPDTVTDGIFSLHFDRWYYTADDCGAGAFQFSSQQRGLELVAAVGRGETPALAEPGGETLNIESNGRNLTHTMQRLTHADGNAPLTSKLTSYLYIVP